MLWIYSLTASWQALAVAAHPASRQVPLPAPLPWLQTFQDPPAQSRAKFRYWLPDASVNVDIVKEDIRSAGSIGAGGVEFLPFYNYGGELPQYPVGADWSVYGFGTPAFKELFRAALEAHREHGLLMDFALGPNQGQGVPAEANDEGLQWDLVPFKANVPPNGSWRAIAPGWGAGRLVSLVSASVVSSRNLSFEAMAQLTPVNITYEQLVVRKGSFADHTSKVLETGHVDLNFDAEDRVCIFAFYENQSHRKALQFPTNKSESIFDRGSYVVDHFSARGAQTVTKFWEEHILDKDMEGLIRTSGEYSWEDSAEIRSNVSWTPLLPSKFLDKFGYSLTLNLPLLSFRQNNIGLQKSEPGSFECLLDTPNQGIDVSNDFQALLAETYSEYLAALRQWTHDRLSGAFSTQPGYNLPLDMMAAIPYVDVPECESLGFRDSIDAYRQFSGPAQISGRRIVSNELGAIFNEAWRYPLSTLSFSANRAFAGGINRMVLHGQGYTGNYFQTTWPGYVGFNHLVSETWTSKQPAWDHGMKHTMDYIARVQDILQGGVAKTDLAIYHKRTGTNFTDVYEFDDLVEAGWSYNYLTSESLSLPGSDVIDGILAPDGPAYTALIVPTDQKLTLDAVKRLQVFAAGGLPVIFTGDSPQAWYSSAGSASKEIMEAELATLQLAKNVFSVKSSDVADRLSAIGLFPRAKPVANGTWYTVWTRSTDTDFVFLYCDSADSEGEIHVSTIKQPYIFNAWTGNHTPIITLEKKDNMTIIPLSLASNQTMIIGFSDQLPRPQRTIATTTTLPNLLGYVANSSTALLHLSRSEDVYHARLSDGKKLVLNTTSVAPSTELFNWTLIAEHWEAPENFSDASVSASKRNTTHEMGTLTSWLDVPELTNASGVGHYTTTFSWPPASGQVNGAYLSLPPIDHALLLRINDEDVLPLDHARPMADITQFLIHGENKVEIIVPTTMWNYIRTVAADIMSSAAPNVPYELEKTAGISMPGKVSNGLLGPIAIIPISSIVV